MHEAEILSASGVALARAIKDRLVTSHEVVRAHIARARRVNPGINAIVRDRYEAALREAREADEKTATVHRDDLPVLHGVPCTIKEAFSLTGMPNSSGLWARRDIVAAEDATVVRRVRAAGAIPLGVTNISELCMWFESQNKVWGRTNNAYDASRTAYRVKSRVQVGRTSNPLTEPTIVSVVVVVVSTAGTCLVIFTNGK